MNPADYLIDLFIFIQVLSYNQKKKKLTKKRRKETRTNLINHIILSHGAQLSYMLGAAYPADYVIDLFVFIQVSFIHPSVLSLFLSRNVVSHPYPSYTKPHFRLLRWTVRDKPAASSPSTRARPPKKEMVLIGTSRAWKNGWLWLLFPVWKWSS